MKKFKTRYISYADGNYSHSQAAMSEHVSENSIFDKIVCYNRDWLVTTQFYEDNKKILDQPRGAGYWLWKPYIILENLKNLKEDEILVYMDVGDKPNPGIADYVKEWLEEKDILLTTGGNNNRVYTKRDALVLMGCDEPKYWDATQVEAGFIALKKKEANFKLVEEWLSWCKDERVITDLENQCGLPNFKSFIDHRHDQSVLSILKEKYNIETTNEFCKHAGRLLVLWNVNH